MKDQLARRDVDDDLLVEFAEPSREPINVRAGVINRGLSIEAIAVLVFVRAMPVLGERVTVDSLAKRLRMNPEWVVQQLAALYDKHELRGTPPLPVQRHLTELAEIRDAVEGRDVFEGGAGR